MTEDGGRTTDDGREGESVLRPPSSVVADPPIPRRTLHLEAAARLRRAIVAGRLAPGTRIKELELCAEYGISRTPLREALRLLAAEGLVRIVPNRGASVVALSPTDAQHAFQVIAALEAEAAALAAERAGAAERREIAGLTAELAARWREGALEAYFALNEKIHARIIAAARNPLLAELHGRVNARLRPVRFQANLTEGRWRAAVAEHEALAAAVAAADGPAAAAVARRHLDHRLYLTPRWREERARAPAGRRRRLQGPPVAADGLYVDILDELAELGYPVPPPGERR
ncbi:MAG: GntR family transcriptional regulator [Alphaproteobacteria bacterium]|nr:GntR family transcriptional regulator [Alphaproteobacteria bacterium]